VKDFDEKANDEDASENDASRAGAGVGRTGAQGGDGGLGCVIGQLGGDDNE